MSARDLRNLSNIVSGRALAQAQEQGLSIADLEVRTGIPARHLCSLLGRYGRWTAGEVIVVAEALGVLASELLGVNA